MTVDQLLGTLVAVYIKYILYLTSDPIVHNLIEAHSDHDGLARHPCGLIFGRLPGSPLAVSSSSSSSEDAYSLNWPHRLVIIIKEDAYRPRWPNRLIIITPLCCLTGFYNNKLAMPTE